MSFWNRYETELLIGFSSKAPSEARVITNWPLYVNRVDACEGFSLFRELCPQEGGREISGTIDQSEYSYVYLRRHMSDQQQAEFDAAKAQLDDMQSEIVDYRPMSFERETVMLAGISERYWLNITTDMGTWIRRLDNHPYAVCVAEQIYGRAPEEGSDVTEADVDRQRTYMLPLGLLSIRKARRQLTEEQRQELRDRLGV